jgi:hypothetical protein
MGSLHIGFP